MSNRVNLSVAPTGILDINATTLKLYRERVTFSTSLNLPTTTKKRTHGNIIGDAGVGGGDEQNETETRFYNEATFITLSHVQISFETPIEDVKKSMNQGAMDMLASLISTDGNLYQDEVVLSLINHGRGLQVRNRKRNKMIVKPLFQLSLPDDDDIGERFKRDLKFTNSVSIKNNRHLKYSPPTLSMTVGADEMLKVEISYEIGVIESLLLPFSVETTNNVRELVSLLASEADLGVTFKKSLNIQPEVFYKCITEKARVMTVREENINSSLFVEDLDTDLLPFQIDSVKWMLSKEGVHYDETTRLLKPMAEVSWAEDASDEKLLEALNRLSFGFRTIKLSESEPAVFFNRFTSNLCSKQTVVRLMNEFVNPDEYLAKAARGILAEEMGLGKTIELVSLSLLNPRPLSQVGGRFEANDREVEKIKSTLVIVPDTILYQWIDEIQLHAPKVEVFWYKGVKNHPNMSNVDLRERFKEADFIITSYAVITSEVHSALYNPSRAKRTRRTTAKAKTLLTEEYKEWAKQEAIDLQLDEEEANGGDDYVSVLSIERVDHTSPLVMVEFWRLIWDESQMVGGFDSNVCTMSTLIPRFHSWSVSGTPIKNNSVDDLISTLIFLRVEPFKSQRKHFTNLTVDEFKALFEFLGIRHTKQMVSSQIAIPPQQRILLSVPFGKLQQDLYRDAFKNFLSDVGLDESGNPVVQGWEPSQTYYESMNEWLKKLRRLCCHPFLVMQEAGKEYRKSKRLEIKNSRKKRRLGANFEDADDLIQLNEFSMLRASAQSMSIVLNKIIYDLNGKSSQLERDCIVSSIELGQIYEFEKSPLEALKVWESQLEIIKERIDKSKKLSVNLALEIKESEQKSESTEFVQEEIEMNGQTLKSYLELLHRVYFFIANAHYQAYNKESEEEEVAAETRVLTEEERAHQAQEVEYYSKAQSVRREILKDSIEEVDKGLAKLDSDHNTESYARFHLLKSFPVKEFENLDEQAFVSKTYSVVALLNSQKKTILKWKEEIGGLFKLPLFDSNSDPSGEEYSNALDSQSHISVYLDFLQRILRDRDSIVNGLAAKELALDLQEEEVMLDQPESESSVLLTRKLNEEYESSGGGMVQEQLSLRSLLIDARRTISSQLDPPSEQMKLNDVIFKAKAVFEKEREDLDQLKKLFRFLNSVFNSQIKYYRQLQAISDNCTSFTDETHRYYDIYDNRRRLRSRIQGNEEQLTKINQRLRFLKSIDDDEMCIICRCSITLGSFTKCGHRFCKECLNEWLRNRASCPVCNERIDTQDMYEFSLNPPEINVTKDIEHGAEAESDLLAANKKQLEQLYSKYSEADLVELNDIKIKNDYGTKINLIVRQVLFLKEKDDDVQILVYSQWSDFLGLIARALDENGIDYLSSKHTLPKVSGSGRSNIKASVEQFKSNPGITCFLLNAKSNASGLNLVNATHVFLCEPLVQTALELQAISRIHRIGQKSATTIWCFIMRDTVEESIILLSARKKIKESESLDTRELAKNSKNLLSKTGEIVDESELWNSFFSSKIH